MTLSCLTQQSSKYQGPPKVEVGCRGSLQSLYNSEHELAWSKISHQDYNRGSRKSFQAVVQLQLNAIETSRVLIKQS